MKKRSLIKSKKNAIYVKECFVRMKMLKIIKTRKKPKHCHYTGKLRGAAHSKCNLNYKVSKNIRIKIHNASYDTHFKINQLAEEFKDKPDCIGENMKKYITFSVPINKKHDDDGKIITQKLRFIDSFRFMNVSLEDLVDNLSGKIFNSIVCTECMERKQINLECFFVGLKNDQLIYRCRGFKKEWGRSIKPLIRNFSSIY